MRTWRRGPTAPSGNAQSALDAAEDAYTSAQKTYDRYAESLDEGDNATIMNQEQALRTGGALPGGHGGGLRLRPGRL